MFYTINVLLVLDVLWAGYDLNIVMTQRKRGEKVREKQRQISQKLALHSEVLFTFGLDWTTGHGVITTHGCERGHTRRQQGTSSARRVWS